MESIDYSFTISTKQWTERTSAIGVIAKPDLGDDAADPLTAILSLTDDEKSDPRVEAAIEEVLEECLRD